MVGQGRFFRPSLFRVDFLIIKVVAQALWQQVTPIAGGVEEDIAGAFLNTAIEQGFELLVARFLFIKRKVIAKQDEAIRLVSQQASYFRKLKQVFLLYLDQA